LVAIFGARLCFEAIRKARAMRFGRTNQKQRVAADRAYRLPAKEAAFEPSLHYLDGFPRC
jgi:hypothetical protein